MSHEEHDEAIHEAELVIYTDRYRPLSLASLADSKLQPPPWLMGPSDPLSDGLIRQKTITMLSAEPFTGKTMLMLAMSLSLASESPLLDYPAQPGQRVAFFGQDAPTWDYMGQLSKLYTGLGKPSLNDGSLLFLNRGWRITDPEFSRFLKETIEIHGITVLMFDTLLAFHDADENSNREMARVMDLLKSWRDNLNCAIIFSHHTSKMKNSGTYAARGASVVSGSVDFHMALTARGAVVSLGLPKRRGSSKRRAEGFTLTDTPNGGIILEPRHVAPSGTTNLLLSFLAAPRTQSEIMTYLSELYGGSSEQSLTGRLHATLAILKKNHKLTHHDDGRISVRPRREGLTLVSNQKEQPDG